MHSRYLSLAQVEAELGLESGDVHALIADGTLPSFVIAGKRRVERQVLDALVRRLVAEASLLIPGTVVGSSSRPSGETAVHAAGTARVVPARGVAGGHDATLDTVTEQQRRILALVGNGSSNAEIARTLTIEISTVKSHVSRLLQRFGLRDREQLIVHLWRTHFMTTS